VPSSAIFQSADGGILIFVILSLTASSNIAATSRLTGPILLKVSQVRDLNHRLCKVQAAQAQTGDGRAVWPVQGVA
jgi:hypothetical protein